MWIFIYRFVRRPQDLLRKYQQNYNYFIVHIKPIIFFRNKNAENQWILFGICYIVYRCMLYDNKKLKYVLLHVYVSTTAISNGIRARKSILNLYNVGTRSILILFLPLLLLSLIIYGRNTTRLIAQSLYGYGYMA